MDRRPAERRMSRDDAESVAIAALGYVASDPELLPRFLALTGIAPDQIRTVAREPGFLAGVLHFVLAHEPTLVAFAAQAGIDPQRVSSALPALPSGDERHERSI